MISRIWHGYTAFENAEVYEKLLKDEIFVHIRNRDITGYRGIHLLRRKLEMEEEFITIMWFDTLDAVREFAGEDYEKAFIPEPARRILTHFDERSQHYEVKVHDFLPPAYEFLSH